jgi:hypothetical protein
VFYSSHIICIYFTYNLAMTCKILLKLQMEWNSNYFKNAFRAFFLNYFRTVEKSAVQAKSEFI